MTTITANSCLINNNDSHVCSIRSFVVLRPDLHDTDTAADC
jgi:hypothetical protein